MRMHIDAAQDHRIGFKPQRDSDYVLNDENHSERQHKAPSPVNHQATTPAVKPTGKRNSANTTVV